MKSYVEWGAQYLFHWNLITVILQLVLVALEIKSTAKPLPFNYENALGTSPIGINVTKF